MLLSSFQQNKIRCYTHWQQNKLIVLCKLDIAQVHCNVIVLKTLGFVIWSNFISKFLSLHYQVFVK